MIPIKAISLVTILNLNAGKWKEQQKQQQKCKILNKVIFKRNKLKNSHTMNGIKSEENIRVERSTLSWNSWNICTNICFHSMYCVVHYIIRFSLLRMHINWRIKHPCLSLFLSIWICVYCTVMFSFYFRRCRTSHVHIHQSLST